jgi:hypothetical protein
VTNSFSVKLQEAPSRTKLDKMTVPTVNSPTLLYQSPLLSINTNGVGMHWGHVERKAFPSAYSEFSPKTV